MPLMKTIIFTIFMATLTVGVLSALTDISSTFAQNATTLTSENQTQIQGIANQTMGNETGGNQSDEFAQFNKTVDDITAGN